MSKKTDDNPYYQAREEPIKRRKGYGDLEQVTKKMWRAVRAAEDMLYQEDASPQQILKAVNSMTNAVNTYTRVYEQANLEGRVDELEEQLEQARKGHPATVN